MVNPEDIAYALSVDDMCWQMLVCSKELQDSYRNEIKCCLCNEKIETDAKYLSYDDGSNCGEYCMKHGKQKIESEIQFRNGMLTQILEHKVNGE